MRGCRRRLAELYLANYAAVLARGAVQEAPQDDSWILRALPPAEQLSAILMKGLWHFVKGRVAIMRRRQLLFNGKGHRGDGNFKLAKRIKSRSRRWPRVGSGSPKVVLA